MTLILGCLVTIGTKEDFISTICPDSWASDTKLSQDLVLQIPVTTQILPAVDHSARPTSILILTGRFKNIESEISIRDFNAGSAHSLGQEAAIQ